MREIPILFSTPMVQAIQDERKSMTRRILHGTKKQNEWIKNAGWNRIIADLSYGDCKTDGLCQLWIDKIGSPLTCVKMPYQPGDRLWVRETWCENQNPNSDNYGGYEYKADYEGAMCSDLITWKSSRFMPKAAARIWLEVVSVRVERLQDITWKDALDEGIDHSGGQDGEVCDYCPLEDNHKGVKNYGNGPSFCVDGGPCNEAQLRFEDDCIDCFAELWDSINAKRGYGWDTNPWVWVIEFRRVRHDR